jgi:hypothetical protein
MSSRNSSYQSFQAIIYELHLVFIGVFIGNTIFQATNDEVSASNYWRKHPAGILFSLTSSCLVNQTMPCTLGLVDNF